MAGGLADIYAVPGFNQTAISVPQPEITFVRKNADGSIDYRVFTEAGRNYVIEISTDLQFWSKHRHFQASRSEYQFNSGALSNSVRYFRVATQ